MLEGKVALVTGSTSGIGFAISRALARAGCRTVLCGRKHTAEIERLRAELAAETDTPVIFQPADVGRPEDVRALIEAVRHALGPIGILVNNAGVQHVAPLAEFPDDAWDRLIATNLSAAFHATKAVLPDMRDTRWGRIINIASVHGLVASAYKAAYVAAKHGLVGLTKVTALETAADGITCNAICPGYVWTPLVEQQVDDQARAHGLPRERVIEEVLLAPQPTRAFIDVDEVAALCVFLCSEQARSITGAALPIEGGWTAR